MNEAKRTAVLGLVFLLCLVLAYVENRSFFNCLPDVFSNPPRAPFLYALLRDLYLKMFIKPTSIRAAMRNIP